MKMNRLITISLICIIAMFSSASDDRCEIKINGATYEIELVKNRNYTWPINTLNNTRFVTCENCAGAGFFWVDTSCGAVWWAGSGETKWVYYGAPGRSGQNGRFIPHKNENGEGLFILDTHRGDGWWTNGKQWKEMGIPVKSAKNANR